MACANFPRGLEFWGSLAPFFFLHILKQKKVLLRIERAEEKARPFSQRV